MNAHDIIANEGGQLTAEDRPNSYDEIRASFVLTALWEAAGATDTDTITIAADGTVGRLTPTWLSPDPAACQYRVVTP